MTPAEGADAASTSLEELLGSLVPAYPAITMQQQQGQRQQQQGQQQQHQVDVVNTELDKRASLSGSFLDELMSDMWNDDDINGGSELVFHDDEELFEIDALSKSYELRAGSALPASTHQDFSPSTPFASPIVSSNPALPAISHSPDAINHAGKRAIKTPCSRAERDTFVPGKTRMRRKLEIQLLRGESEKLQTKLQKLREYWKQMSAAMEQATWAKNADKSQSLRAALVRVEPMWKPIAVRQRDALSRSERENQELKTRFQLQRKMLQRLRKLIAKRITAANKMGPKILDVPFPNPQFVVAGCTATLHKLLYDSVSMYLGANKIQRLFQMRLGDTGGTQTFRKWAVKEDGNVMSDTRVEMVDNHEVPFDHRQVSEALKRSYSLQNLKQRKDIGEYFQASDDTIARQYISSFRNHRSSGVVRVKEGIRMFADETQTIFVVSSLIERLSDSGKSSPLIRAKKWVIVRSCSSDKGGTSPATSIQSFYTFELAVMLQEYSVLWRKPILEDVFVPILDLGISKGHQELENMLFEQGGALSKWTSPIGGVH